jgi:hypothetical protein
VVILDRLRPIAARLHPLNPLTAVLAQIHQSLARIGRDTAYTLIDVRKLKEELMARMDDLEGKLDRDDENTSRPDSGNEPATDEPAQPEPTNPADNPNEPDQG